MAEISAKVIADSISPGGDRLTTMVVTMHRFILPEFNTHRKFSRSSASSRAIPLRKRLDEFWNDPMMPISWPAEQPGMQGGKELTDDHQRYARNLFWNCWDSTGMAIEEYLDKCDHQGGKRLHKSVINRLLEPFLSHTVVVSSTEWDNFFRQRCSPLAQPEMRVLAERMREALEGSTPRPCHDLQSNGVHLPFIKPGEMFIGIEQAIRCSVARCARVSYLNHDGEYSIESDEALFRKLVTADPPHWAPLEMVATPGDSPLGNFDGWVQLRHNDYLLGEVMKGMPDG